MIDCHCHLLFGLDDGPETLDEALSMARILSRYGFSVVHCTPHCISGLYENTPAIVRDRLTCLQQALVRAEIPIRLKPGMEYYLDGRFSVQLSDAQPLGESRLLLVEAPAWAGGEMIVDNIRQIVARGFVPLFAHPERCQLISAPGQGVGLWATTRRLLGGEEPKPSCDLLSQLQSLGCLFQGNLGSFAGRYGKLVEKRAVALLEAGVYSCLGSDSHPLPGLEEMISGGLESLRRLTSNYSQLLSADRLFL